MTDMPNKYKTGIIIWCPLFLIKNKNLFFKDCLNIKLAKLNKNNNKIIILNKTILLSSKTFVVFGKIEKYKGIKKIAPKYEDSINKSNILLILGFII